MNKSQKSSKPNANLLLCATIDVHSYGVEGGYEVQQLWPTESEGLQIECHNDYFE
jgi:hypothetical protein